MKSSQSKPQQLDQDMPALHALLAKNMGDFKNVPRRNPEMDLEILMRKKANEVKI